MKVLLISNGHGEDVMAAAIGQVLVRLGVEVEAVPLVGEGRAYDAVGIESHGPKRALPSGGYTLRGPRPLLADLRAGLVAATASSWRAVRERSRGVDARFVVGDPYASLVTACNAPGRRYYLPSAVSVRAWTFGPLPFQAPFGPLERGFMRRSRRVYPIDGDTVAWLERRGVSNVADLGNPMLDAVEGDATLDAPPPYLLLLPGTREDRWFSLPRMIQAAAGMRDAGLHPVVAWSGAAQPPVVDGWGLAPTGRRRGVVASYQHPDGTSVSVAREAFATALASAHLAFSTSGTAAQQCAGFGIPIVAFATPGPQFTETFALAQKRTLGEALELTEADPVAIASVARTMLGDRARLARATQDGRRAMGLPGAAERIARDVLGDLQSDPSGRLAKR